MEDLMFKYQDEYYRFNEMVLNRNYDVLFKEYTPLLKLMLNDFESLQLDEVKNIIEDIAPFDMESTILYMSSLNGDTLKFNCFEGDITDKLWQYIGCGILDYDLQFIIDDENFFEDEFYIEDYINSWNEVLKPLGKELYYKLDDQFSDGVYFIYLDNLNRKD